MSQTIISVDTAELAAILAALRFYQREGQGTESRLTRMGDVEVLEKSVAVGRRVTKTHR